MDYKEMMDSGIKEAMGKALENYFETSGLGDNTGKWKDSRHYCLSAQIFSADSEKIVLTGLVRYIMAVVVELDKEIEAAEEENRKLDMENARLHAQVQILEHQKGQSAQEIDRLKQEIERLRKREMKIVKAFDIVDPIVNAINKTGDKPLKSELQARFKELFEILTKE